MKSSDLRLKFIIISTIGTNLMILISTVGVLVTNSNRWLLPRYIAAAIAVISGLMYSLPPLISLRSMLLASNKTIYEMSTPRWGNQPKNNYPRVQGATPVSPRHGRVEPSVEPRQSKVPIGYSSRKPSALSASRKPSALPSALNASRKPSALSAFRKPSALSESRVPIRVNLNSKTPSTFERTSTVSNPVAPREDRSMRRPPPLSIDPSYDLKVSNERIVSDGAFQKNTTIHVEKGSSEMTKKLFRLVVTIIILATFVLVAIIFLIVGSSTSSDSYSTVYERSTTRTSLSWHLALWALVLISVVYAYYTTPTTQKKAANLLQNRNSSKKDSSTVGNSRTLIIDGP